MSDSLLEFFLLPHLGQKLVPVLFSRVCSDTVLRFFIGKTYQAADVLAQNVELNVYLAAFLYVAEVGVCECIGYYTDLKAVIGRIAYSEAYAVHSNAAFVYGTISSLRHLAVVPVSEREYGAAFSLFYSRAFGSGVYVSLYNVSIQAPVHRHGTFHVYFVTYG